MPGKRAAERGGDKTEPNLIAIIRETINSSVYYKSDTKWKESESATEPFWGSFADYQWKRVCGMRAKRKRGLGSLQWSKVSFKKGIWRYRLKKFGKA